MRRYDRNDYYFHRKDPLPWVPIEEEPSLVDKVLGVIAFIGSLVMMMLILVLLR